MWLKPQRTRYAFLKRRIRSPDRTGFHTSTKKVFKFVGADLHTIIFSPKTRAEPLPFIAFSDMAVLRS